MPVAVAFVGKSGSGKTTITEKVVAELVARGYKVGACKYFGKHTFDVDLEGKDSWRFTQAGAVQTAICSNGQLALMRDLEEPLTQGQVAARMDGVDIVVFEGHRITDIPVFQLLRTGCPRYEDAIAQFEPTNTLAIITDGDEGRALAAENGLPALDFSDLATIMLLIEEKVLAGTV